MEYYLKHEAFVGEVIMQADNPQIEASWYLSEIADNIIEFKVY